MRLPRLAAVALLFAWAVSMVAPSESTARERSSIFYVRLTSLPNGGAAQIAELLQPAAGEGFTFHAAPEHPNFSRDSVAARAGVRPEMIPDLGLIYRLAYARPLHSDSTVRALEALPIVVWAEPATGLELRTLSDGCRHQGTRALAATSRPSTSTRPRDIAPAAEDLARASEDLARVHADSAAGSGRVNRTATEPPSAAAAAAPGLSTEVGPDPNDAASSITVGIFDHWHSDATGPLQLPAELGAINPPLSRLIVQPHRVCSDVYGGSYAGHGLQVASVAASSVSTLAVVARGRETDIRLRGYWSFLRNIPEIVDDGVRVLSISALYTDRPRLREYVKYALAHDVVVVAAAGNYLALDDGVNYPAAYFYEDLNLQVIAVAATDEGDQPVPGFVKSPGADPHEDPPRAFIDVAAPGVDVGVIEARFDPDGDTFSFASRAATGTSLSVPAVSTLAAILLERDPELTPRDVYDLITGSADKTGDVDYVNGWSRALGYGRINPGRALEALAKRRYGTAPGTERNRTPQP